MMAKKEALTKIEFLILIVIIGLISYMFKMRMTKYSSLSFYKTNLRKAVAELNLGINKSNLTSTEGTMVCDTSLKLTEFFKKNMKIKKANLKKNEIYSKNGMKYIFTSKGKCGDADSSNNPKFANCYVTVDVNGNDKPNELSSGNNSTNFKLKDRYILIIKSNSIEPATSKENSVSENAVYN